MFLTIHSTSTLGTNFSNVTVLFKKRDLRKKSKAINLLSYKSVLQQISLYFETDVKCVNSLQLTNISIIPLLLIDQLGTQNIDENMAQNQK